MATYGTLADIRTELRVRLGLPDRGTSGDSRLNIAINMALRQCWSEMPKALLSEEMRFRMEVPYSTGTVTIQSDPLVLLGVGTSWATDKTLRARTIEILNDGTYYYRKIQDVWTSGSSQYLTIDSPLEITATGLSYRIFTPEYPYTSNVQSIIDVVRDPDTSPHPLVESAFSGEVHQYRSTIGFRSEGIPDYYTRGDFFQLPSPNYAPGVKKSIGWEPGRLSEGVSWGFTPSGSPSSPPTENTKYGPAGTFSYRVIHVWGRWTGYEKTNEGLLKPFYQSAPSTASVEVTTEWGSGAVKITTPNIDYVHGYGDTAVLSGEHYGVEKWIFRARHDTEPTTSSVYGTVVENDKIYYLWKVTNGYDTEVFDYGQEDPVDKRITLEPFHGHFHIRFDRQPTSAVPVLMRTFKRPPSLKYDTDSPRIPPECYDALYALTASYLVGDRDGSPDRKSMYYAEYKEHLSRLRRTYNVAGHQVGSFGNGINVRNRRPLLRRNQPITSSS